MPAKRRGQQDASQGDASQAQEVGVELAGTEVAAVRTALIEGTTFGVRPVQYSVVDGMAVFEGDIILGSEEEVQAQTDVLQAVSRGEIAAAAVIAGSQFRWPNCTIPYDVDAGLANSSRVTDAVTHWQANTSFRFVQRTVQHQDWVTFRPASGCSSAVGRRGGQQFVNLGPSCTVGNVIHEIGHVVGLWHEQSREDRDSFVTVHWEKIEQNALHNFDQHITDGDDVGAYDYASIMHYPRNAFSIDGSDTITPVQAGAQIGQRTGLSVGDIAAANSMCGPVVPKPVKDVIRDPVGTLKEAIRDPIGTLKEPVRDPIGTLKERIKDIRLDTVKERILDTIKEPVRDPIKRIPSDPGTLVENIGRLPGRPIPGMGAGALPFAMAAPHQAPAAQGYADPESTIGALDEHLQVLAQAIQEAETHRSELQTQYDATATALAQALDELDQQT
jgi:hypothetical protein